MRMTKVRKLSTVSSLHFSPSFPACPILFPPSCFWERVIRQVKSVFCKYFRLFESLRSHLIEIAKDHFKYRLTKPLNFHFVRMQSLISRFLYDEFQSSVLLLFLCFTFSSSLTINIHFSNTFIYL